MSLPALLAPGKDVKRFDQEKAARISGFVINVKSGGSESCNCGATNPDERDTHIELCLAAAAPETQRVVAEVTPRLRMLKKKAGSIVNMSSAISSIRGVPDRYVYGATKAAVIGLTKQVAADFIRQGIRVNAICPGTIESPSLEDRIAELSRQSGKPVEAVRQAFIDRQPMGRLGTPQEIAALAVYLASDESSYTTGQIHLADGGFAL